MDYHFWWPTIYYSTLFLCVASSFSLPQNLVGQDCTQARLTWKSTGDKNFDPCVGADGRTLVRKVDCMDGTVMYICCRFDRNDIQQSRQKVFRAVTLVGDIISYECTKRILCEAACRDGLDKLWQDYPQALPDDTSVNKDYVRAFKIGEMLSCHRDLINSNTNHEPCKSNCRKMYPRCDRDMGTSFMTKVYDMWTPVLHNLGMLWFRACWWVRDARKHVTKLLWKIMRSVGFNI